MMKERIILIFKIIRYIFPTIYLNFKYLPLKQAMKLPIVLYKPHLLKCKGKIIIDSPVKFGMIKLGFLRALIYPNTGFSYENNGGTVIFHGKCSIGNHTFLSVGSNAVVEFGEDFRNNAGAKICSVHGIKFGNYTSLGWNVLVLDTNFHPLYDMTAKQYRKSGGQISIGDYNWFGTDCKIMHSVTTPERCIFSVGSIITHSTPVESYCVSNNSKIILRNVLRTDRGGGKYLNIRAVCRA